ncbi:hypothetical protein [Mucilaginibacter sp. PAMB04168]|uniref:hypothetical protein n=1 Tax=Mucilaginibacter sp. PAMB04168 TaxID=3138567 RepID=UPI0031F6558D
MKKILMLSLLVFACAITVKAQSNRTLPNTGSSEGLKPEADTSVAALRGLQPKATDLLKYLGETPSDAVIAAKLDKRYGSIVYSTMPVAGRGAARSDSMPIAKLGDPNTRYTMLVKRITIANPTKTEVAKP